tara:strand:+ start:369 stop:515 length:147 start_codon:yes stop_codon:yes gene_type:complete
MYLNYAGIIFINGVFNQARINLPDLAPGTYFVRILSDLGNQQIKVRVK